MIDFAIVVPTIGRPSLTALIESLARCDGPPPDRILVVDDRRGSAAPLPEFTGWPAELITVCRSGGRGPAAARNAGWRASGASWIAFLDDDVVVTDTWLRDLATDLAAAPDDVAGVQGRIDVPVPIDRPLTDWERNTVGLATAKWITADMAYRRSALLAVGGFDERFPRAFREDADIALRIDATGGRILLGERITQHPVRPAPWNVSVRQQRGNADDALLRRLHGRDWHERADSPRGRRNRHFVITALGAGGVAAALARRPRIAVAAAAGWATLTAEFGAARITAGPRTTDEIATMAATSVLIPPLATVHWLRGVARHRAAEPWRPAVECVLVDRDGTIVEDVPYNGDPDLVRPVAGARVALDRLRTAGIKIGVVTNQSGIARGLLSRDQVDAVNARVEQLLGPFDDWQVCPHAEADRCDCRKPAPGMVLAAARRLGADPARCVLIGDIATDVGAAEAAGAVGVLVPNATTRRAEVDAAAHTMASLAEVVDVILQRPAELVRP